MHFSSFPLCTRQADCTAARRPRRAHTVLGGPERHGPIERKLGGVTLVSTLCTSCSIGPYQLTPQILREPDRGAWASGGRMSGGAWRGAETPVRSSGAGGRAAGPQCQYSLPSRLGAAVRPRPEPLILPPPTAPPPALRLADPRPPHPAPSRRGCHTPGAGSGRAGLESAATRREWADDEAALLC